MRRDVTDDEAPRRGALASATRRAAIAAAFLAAGCGSRSGLDVGSPPPDTTWPTLGGACAPGFADCDGDPATVCETDVSASSDNCGACGVSCPAGTVCAASACHGPRDIVRLAAVSLSTCAMRASGEVLCWGYNGYGELGDGTTDDRSAPAPVVGLDDATNIFGGSRSSDTFCALRRTGDVVCWGNNAIPGSTYGLISDDLPASVTRPSSAFQGVAGIVSVATGEAATCVLRTDGTVLCRGDDTADELGVAGPVTTAGPFQVARVHDAVELTNECVREATGEVACWGFEVGAKLDVGTALYQNDYVPLPEKIAGIEDAVAIRAFDGDDSRCVVHRSGQVSEWGFYTPVLIETGAPTLMFPRVLTSIVEVSLGYEFACGREASGRVLCWGFDSDTGFVGLLGAGPGVSGWGPVAVIGLTDATALVAGIFHTCALRSSGAVVCWGDNENGQLGEATSRYRTTPGVVRGLE